MRNHSFWLFIVVILFSLTSQVCSATDYPIKLEKIKIKTHDQASVQRGAKFFASYCLVCHSLQYLGDDPIAKRAGITLDKMPTKNQKWWFGVAPPDLSLVAKVYGKNWLYTYLHVFYKDPTRSIGTNNLLVNNVSMPNPFLGLQGDQELIVKRSSLIDGILIRQVPYYTVLKLTRAGSMSPDEFDKAILDVVNFLVYASEPKKYAREQLGVGVLLFLIVFLVLVYLLKRLYWKRIK